MFRICKCVGSQAVLSKSKFDSLSVLRSYLHVVIDKVMKDKKSKSHLKKSRISL